MRVKLKKAVVIVSCTPYTPMHALCAGHRDKKCTRSPDLPPSLLPPVQPAATKEVVDRVASTPFSELPTVLQDFKWSFDKVRAGAAGEGRQAPAMCSTQPT